MKTDNYTKFILTVIAVCLVVIVAKDVSLVTDAHAGNEVTQLPPNPNYGLIPINADGTVTVKLSPNDVMDVNIKGISTRDELDVNIDEIGGGYVSMNGPLPVKIKE